MPSIIRHRSLFVLLSLTCLACASTPQGTEHQRGKEGDSSMTGDLSRVDHIILGINDLQRGIEELERLTGVRAVFGGAHPGRGTQNALISLGEPHYLEILAPNPEEEGSAHVDELRKLTSLTPVGWAAQAEDLPALQQTLRGQGIQTGEVQPGARNRPDGSRLAWKTLTLGQIFSTSGSSEALLPFFIEWDPTGTHPSATSPGGCRLTGFALEDPAPDALRKPLQAAGLQVEVREGKEPRIWLSLACPRGNVEFP